MWKILPRALPAEADAAVAPGVDCGELLLSSNRQDPPFELLSFLTYISVALGNGMGWLIPNSSSWACCLLKATWEGEHLSCGLLCSLKGGGGDFTAKIWWQTPDKTNLHFKQLVSVKTKQSEGSDSVTEHFLIFASPA